jgi:hypothetical protein
MTERPRISRREPRSLQSEQLGNLTVCRPAVPHSVHAWILWEDSVEELVQAHAIAWTKRAVQVRFGAPPHLTWSGCGPKRSSGSDWRQRDQWPCLQTMTWRSP